MKGRSGSNDFKGGVPLFIAEIGFGFNIELSYFLSSPLRLYTFLPVREVLTFGLQRD
jgi:hypothetical protein